MTAARHTHRADPELTRIYPWTQCIDWRHPHSEVTHGNVVEVQRCACGAWRLVELNGAHRHAGPWQAPQEAAAQA